MMRRWLLFGGILVLLASCKSDENTTTSNAKVAAGQESFTWGTGVRSQDIRLTEKASWSVTCDGDCRNWCYPVKTSGNSASIPLWVSPNITSKERSGKVTVTVGGSRQVITVRQPAFTGDIDDYVYHLPVVFHVLYKDAGDETQNIPESQFTKILAAVNELYDDNQMNITFEMAKYDKDGEVLDEPGIIRHQVSFDEMDAKDFLGSSDDKYDQYVSYQLNLKKYINIFVFRFTQTDETITTLGLTTLPLVTKAHPLDGLTETDRANDYTYLDQTWGVCINNQCIYEWQDEKTVNTRYIVATMAHELGHYLGLLHTFSENECSDDDYCDDTPVSDYYEYVDYISEYIEKEQQKAREQGEERIFSIKELATRTDCMTGEEFVATNILDYTFTYNTDFTSQQFDRTRHVLKYSPLVPGPKLVDYNTVDDNMRSASLPPHFNRPVPCPGVPARGKLPVVMR